MSNRAKKLAGVSVTVLSSWLSNSPCLGTSSCHATSVVCYSCLTGERRGNKTSIYNWYKCFADFMRFVPHCGVILDWKSVWLGGKQLWRIARSSYWRWYRYTIGYRWKDVSTISSVEYKNKYDIIFIFSTFEDAFFVWVQDWHSTYYLVLELISSLHCKYLVSTPKYEFC